MGTAANKIQVPQRNLILTALRPLLIIVVMLAVDRVAPMEGDGVITTVVVTAIVGLAVFSAVFVYQVRRIRRSNIPL